jgi:hypothetical protein
LRRPQQHLPHRRQLELSAFRQQAGELKSRTMFVAFFQLLNLRIANEPELHRYILSIFKMGSDQTRMSKTPSI